MATEKIFLQLKKYFCQIGGSKSLNFTKKYLLKFLFIVDKGRKIVRIRIRMPGSRRQINYGSNGSGFATLLERDSLNMLSVNPLDSLTAACARLCG